MFPEQIKKPSIIKNPIYTWKAKSIRDLPIFKESNDLVLAQLCDSRSGLSFVKQLGRGVYEASSYASGGSSSIADWLSR